MTISSQQGRQQYAGAGTTGPFAVPFKFFANTDLRVVKQSSAGVDSTLTLNVDYTATGAGNELGGSVTTTANVAIGETLSIILDPPRTQSTDYVSNDAFAAESHERALDRLTQQSIRTRDIAERSIRLADGDANVLPYLPGAAARASKFLSFAAGSGDPEVSELVDSGLIALSQSIIAQYLWPQIGQELVAPTNFHRLVDGPIIDARRYLAGAAYATAIQTAIDVARQMGGGEVYLANTVGWNIGATTIRTYDGVWIVGGNYVFNSASGTVVTYTGNGNAFESGTRDATRIWSGGFRQLKIVGNGKLAGSCGIDCRRVDDFTLSNVWVTDFDIGLRFDGTGAAGYRNRIYGGGYTHNNTGVQVINAANEQRIIAAIINNNTNYGLDVQDGNSVRCLDVNFESNGVHVRTADQHTRVFGGRMEAATVRPWETTSTAEYFRIGGGIYWTSDNGAAPLDAGKFTRIDLDDHDSARGYNMVRNGSFEAWSAGTAVAPDRWTASNVTVARDTDEQDGTYSALLTAVTTGGLLFQDIPLPLQWADGRREFLVTCRLKLGTSTQAALSAAPQDGGGTGQGVVLDETRAVAVGNRVTTTTAGWHTLKLIVRPNSSAVRIRVGCEPDKAVGTGTCYFDAINVSPLGAGREEYFENPRDLAPGLKQILVRTAVLDFSGANPHDLTVTVPGAQVNDGVIVNEPNWTADADFKARVSAPDTVEIRKTGAGDPPSGTYTVIVCQR